MIKLPNDGATRAAMEQHEDDLKLIENEVMGNNGPTCTCPDWWFPEDIRDKARLMPHMYQGALAHHDSCERKRSYDFRRGMTYGRKTRFA